MDSLSALVVPGAVTIALVGGTILYVDGRRTKRRARWHANYYYGGGLVRALMQNWGKGTKRLTDQRDRLG